MKNLTIRWILTIQTDNEPPLFTQTPGLPGKKGDQVYYIFLLLTVVCSHAFHRVDFHVVIFTGWERPAWSRGPRGGKGRARAERSQGQRVVDSHDALENIEYSTSKLCNYTLHDISMYHQFLKGSPGPAGTGVVGAKGESGERVRSLWKLKITVYSCCEVFCL